MSAQFVSFYGSSVVAAAAAAFAATPGTPRTGAISPVPRHRHVRALLQAVRLNSLAAQFRHPLMPPALLPPPDSGSIPERVPPS